MNSMRPMRRHLPAALYRTLVALALLAAAAYALLAPGHESQAQSPVPAAPTGLTATSVSNDSVALSWDDPGDDSITGYQVLRRSRDGDEYGDGQGAAAFVAVVDDTGSAAASHTDTSVTSRTRYVYRVKAINAAGLSERSTYLNVETLAVPAKPTGLSAASVAHDSVALTWDDPGDDSITGYRVLRRSRDGDEYEDGEGAAAFVAVVDDTGSPATSHTDTSVTARTRYVYRVKAINAAGLSGRSTWLNVETPAAPPPTPAPVVVTATFVLVTPETPEEPEVALQQTETREAADSGGFLQVDAGWDYACGLRVDGTVTCWLGTNHGHGYATESTFYISYPQEERHPEGTYKFIRAGNLEHCAVSTDGDPACWGLTYAGRAMEAREPKPLSSVHLHTQHSPCWLYEDGDIGCGGGLSLPDAIASEAPFQDVVTGRNFACGLKEDGALLCWDHDGPLDGPDVNLRFISGGGYGVCGIRSADDTLICWEWSYESSVDQHPENSYETVESTPSGGFKFVDTSYGLSCGVRMDGSVVCWGEFSYGPSTESGLARLNAGPDGPFETVSVDWYFFACGLRTDKTVACWNSLARDDALAAGVAPPFESPWKNSADLLALELSAGQLSPSFDRETTSYTAPVANDVASLTLSPGLSNTLATYEIGSDTDSEVSGDTVDLTAGDNVITVTVLSADTTETRTYTVTVTRASS